MELQKLTVTQITDVFTVYSTKGDSEKMSNRPAFGLSLCIDGRITYVQNGREYVSDRSCAVLLPKGQDYWIRRDKTGSFPVINFECLDPLCDTVTVIPVQNAEALLSDYERIKRLFCFEGSRAKILSIFYDMLHKLSADAIPRELDRAIQLIRRNYADPALTNASLARECNISEVYFRKQFAKYFKTSPKQFVLDIRMQRAKQLLSEGVLKVSAIAEACGFSNPYHFCRMFKQHTGSTPSEYREENLIYKI